MMPPCQRTQEVIQSQSAAEWVVSEKQQKTVEICNTIKFAAVVWQQRQQMKRRGTSTA
jgi:hypothetical protein